MKELKFSNPAAYILEQIDSRGLTQQEVQEIIEILKKYPVFSELRDPLPIILSLISGISIYFNNVPVHIDFDQQAREFNNYCVEKSETIIDLVNDKSENFVLDETSKSVLEEVINSDEFDETFKGKVRRLLNNDFWNTD